MTRKAAAASETALIKGYDFSTLQMIADDLQYRFEELEEIDPNSIRPDLQRSAPEIQVIPQPMALFDQDLRVNQVLSAVSDANPEGFQAQTDFLKADGSEIPIEVRPTEDPEADGPGREGVGAIAVLGGAGEYVPLGELAHVGRHAGCRAEGVEVEEVLAHRSLFTPRRGLALLYQGCASFAFYIIL